MRALSSMTGKMTRAQNIKVSPLILSYSSAPTRLPLSLTMTMTKVAYPSPRTASRPAAPSVLFYAPTMSTAHPTNSKQRAGSPVFGNTNTITLTAYFTSIVLRGKNHSLLAKQSAVRAGLNLG